jgi:hypothetical protein
LARDHIGSRTGGRRRSRLLPLTFIAGTNPLHRLAPARNPARETAGYKRGSDMAPSLPVGAGAMLALFFAHSEGITDKPPFYSSSGHKRLRAARNILRYPDNEPRCI